MVPTTWIGGEVHGCCILSSAGPASPCTLIIWTTCSGDSFAASVPETGTRFLLGARGRPYPRVCVLYYIRYLLALQLFWLDRFTGVSWGGNPPFLFHPPGAVAMAPGGSATITVMATTATTMVVTKSPGSLSTRQDFVPQLKPRQSKSNPRQWFSSCSSSESPSSTLEKKREKARRTLSRDDPSYLEFLRSSEEQQRDRDLRRQGEPLVGIVEEKSEAVLLLSGSTCAP